MTPQDNPGRGHDYYHAGFEAIVSGVRQIDRKVSGIETRLNEHYHLLREILEQMGKEDEAGWYDAYENGNGNDEL